MKKLRTTLIFLAGLVVIGATLYATWKFACLELPHPMRYVAQYMPPGFQTMSTPPTVEKYGASNLVLFPFYWLTGVGTYLCLGLFVASPFPFLARWSEIGYEAACEEKRHADAVWAHRDRREERRMKREQQAQQQPTTGWSVGAVVFGLFLGWLLFKD